MDPFQAAKAWQLRKQLKRPWKEVRKALRTAAGGQPGRHAVEDAIARIEAQRHTSKFRREGVAVLAHSKCGRKPALTSTQRAAVVDFVKRWRHKRFCTASYIIQELRLPCKKTTVYRVLNSAGYHWRSVAKKGKLTEAQLAARKVFVDAHLDKSAAWWRQHFGLVLDGVALTWACTVGASAESVQRKRRSVIAMPTHTPLCELASFENKRIVRTCLMGSGQQRLSIPHRCVSSIFFRAWKPSHALLLQPTHASGNCCSSLQFELTTHPLHGHEVGAWVGGWVGGWVEGTRWGGVGVGVR